MNAVSPKEYIARAKELEIAIFVEKKLMSEHEKALYAQRPKAPVLETISAPSEQSRPQFPQDYSKNRMLRVAIIVSVFFLCLHLYATSAGEWVSDSGPLTMLGISLFLFFLAFAESKGNRVNYEEQVRAYNYQITEYKKTVEQYETAKRKAASEYGKAMEEYRAQINECKNAETQAMIPHNALLQQLEEALTAHYDENILFSKYRNLVAVTTIDEYLQSGRCDKLEGSDGAYNLYEMELRQNIVIGQLSMILDNMEQIKNNQYTLYQELTHANVLISEIISEVREMKTLEKLNAYFSSVTAKAAISPTYIHGHIY